MEKIAESHQPTLLAAVVLATAVALTATPALAGQGNGKGKAADHVGKAEGAKSDHHNRNRAEDNTGHVKNGKAKSDEMRARREERKTIKEEYRANREPGQEGRSNRPADGEAPQKKAKKPWYKFWQRD